MREGYVFVTEGATVDNLDSLSREQSIINERKLLEFSDIVSSATSLSCSLKSSGFGIYEILSFIADGLTFGAYPMDGGHIPEYAEALKASLVGIRGFDRALFSDLYVSAMSGTEYPLTERDFLPEADAEETVTYVKNRFSDEAFDVLSQDFRGPRVKYSRGFKECAQAIADGEVSYCLLPLEEKGGSRLPTVAELIYRYDFKINFVTPVFGYEADADLKYALISKHFTVPERIPGDDRYLELRLSSSAETTLSELLSASAYFGMSVYRVNTVTFDTEGEQSTFFSLVLRDGGRDFTGLLTYLALFAPDFVPVGVYKNLE